MNYDHAKATRTMREYKSLEALVSACFEGAIDKEQFTHILRNIRQGIGLAKRDRYLAEGLERGVSDMADPRFTAGWEAGFEAGKASVIAEAPEGETS
jgi:hypothetical protein